MNVVAFIGNEAGDIQADLSIAKDAVNIEVIKNLLYFICDNERGDKVLSEITNLSRGKNSSTVFFDFLVCNPLLKLLLHTIEISIKTFR